MIERNIKTISFGKAIRTRKGMYLSADNQEALFLVLREAYINSLDGLVESNRKDGVVKVKIDSKSRKVIVADNGPGIPIIKREDGTNSLIAAYTLSHTGSHFDERKTNAAGLNGIGAKCILFTSESFKVECFDGKKFARAEFKASEEEGAILTNYEEKEIQTQKTGVTLEYIPDKQIFETAWFDEKALEQEFSELMRFYPKYTLVLEMDGHQKSFNYPEGLKQSNTIMYYESPNLIFSLNTEGNGIIPYGNRLRLTQGGNFYSHFRTQLTKTINEYSNIKFKGEQILTVFGGRVAVFVESALFSNQSKTALFNKEVNPEITTAIKSEIGKLVQTPLWDKILKTLETEAKADEAAQKTKERLLKVKKEFAAKKINTMSDKFCDTDSKDRKNCDLYLAEGED